MQRLFGTFPCGLPGAGLLLLRAATALPLIYAGVRAAAAPSPAALELAAAAAAILLLIGFWTPFAGGAVAAAALGLAWSHSGHPWTFVHFAVLGAALAMLGPGGCSVDARLFGRKYIDLPTR